MEVVSAEVGGVNVKVAAGGVAGSEGSGLAISGGTSSSSAATAVVSKRRKVDVRSGNGGEFGDASADSAYVFQCERFDVAAEEVNMPAAVENFAAPVAAKEDGERCLSGDMEDPGTSSCCSSNESSEAEKETIELVDLEAKSGEVDTTAIQSSHRRERMQHGGEDGTESDADEENSRPKPLVVMATAAAVGNSRRRQLPGRIPSQAEIENFFSVIEKRTALQFKEKYNFDFEKEEPLRGRYEWKPLTAAAAAAAAAASPKEKEVIKS